MSWHATFIWVDFYSALTAKTKPIFLIGSETMSNNPFEDHSSSPFPSPSKGEPQRKQASGMKTVLIVIGSIFGVMALCCCGVGGWVIYKARGAFVTDPSLVQAKAKTIVDMDYPSELTPVFAMDIIVVKMAMFVSGSQQSPEGDLLMVMSVPNEGEVDRENLTSQMEQQLNQQSAQNPNAKIPSLDVTNRGTRKFMVKGQEVEFSFNEAKDSKSGELFFQVSGAYSDENSSDKKATLVFMQVRQSKFREERIKQVIESIK
jgi:hypothetical protein